MASYAYPHLDFAHSVDLTQWRDMLGSCCIASKRWAMRNLPLAIIHMLRWQLEVTFEEALAPLGGIESQCQQPYPAALCTPRWHYWACSQW